MAYGIVVWIAAVLTQIQEPASKPAAAPSAGAAKAATNEETSDRLKEARRLLRNGRYAESEEKLKEIREESKKAATVHMPEVARRRCGVDAG